MKHADWVATLGSQGIRLGAPPIDDDYLSFTAPPQNTSSVAAKERRGPGCNRSNVIVVDKTEDFVDWDVQMSPVTCASQVNMTIAITSGYTVTNTVGVSAGLDIGLVKDLLKTSIGINYSRSWTSGTMITTTGTVPANQCGAMIDMPNVTRRYGRVLRGCPGSYTQIGTFMADSHAEANYNGVHWVSGAISICSKPQSFPPLSRCHGLGNFV